MQIFPPNSPSHSDTSDGFSLPFFRGCWSVFFSCLCVCLCCFGPMGDCCHCCVKQIRELGGFWQDNNTGFLNHTQNRYIVSCISVHIHTLMLYTNLYNTLHTHIMEVDTYTHIPRHSFSLSTYSLAKHNVVVG